LLLAKFQSTKPLSVIHYVPANKAWYVKRFLIETTTQNKRFPFIAEEKGAKVALVSLQAEPLVEIEIGNKKSKEKSEINLREFIDVKGWKALGNKLTADNLLAAKLVSDEQNEHDTPEATQSTEELELEDSANLEAITTDEPMAEDEPAATDVGVDIGTTIEFDVKKEREQKGGEPPQQLNLF